MSAQATLPCSFPACRNKRRAVGLCSSHWMQRARGKPLTPLKGGQPRPASQAFREQLRRVAEMAGVVPTEEQAKIMGITITRLTFLRYRARLEGYEVKRLKHGPRFEPEPPPELEEILGRSKEPRCRCGLRLPCNGCLPLSASAFALNRTGEGAVLRRGR